MLRILVLAIAMIIPMPGLAPTTGDLLYRFDLNGHPRWTTPENPDARKGGGGVAIRGAKTPF